MELFPGFFVLNRLNVSKLRLITSCVKFGTCLSFVIYTRILHCVAGVQSVYNTLVHLSSSAFGKAIASDCGLIRHCFLSSSASVYTFTGFNSRYKCDIIKKYSNDDITCANFIRDIRLNLLSFDSVVVTNSVMYSICCD